MRCAPQDQATQGQEAYSFQNEVVHGRVGRESLPLSVSTRKSQSPCWEGAGLQGMGDWAQGPAQRSCSVLGGDSAPASCPCCGIWVCMCTPVGVGWGGEALKPRLPIPVGPLGGVCPCLLCCRVLRQPGHRCSVRREGVWTRLHFHL